MNISIGKGGEVTSSFFSTEEIQMNNVKENISKVNSIKIRAKPLFSSD